MPLSPSQTPRRHLHTRQIELNGYQREDGLFDVEARLADTKTYPFELQDRGPIEPGEPLHGMAMRMTVDDTLTIVAFEAATDYSPYSICPEIAPNYARLAGLQIRAGFLRAANERVGGVHGCTHLRELLQQMATVAFQTLYSQRAGQAAKRPPSSKPPLLNSCYAYRDDGPIVARNWPEFYTGERAEAAEDAGP